MEKYKCSNVRKIGEAGGRFSFSLLLMIITGKVKKVK